MMRCYAMNARLSQCDHCRGFLPRGATRCPHCSLAAKRTLTTKLCAAAATLGAGSIAFTLMACYGAPPCPDGTRDCYKPTPNGEAEGGAPSMSPDGGK
jgi:hypothetical protein